jgi:hypothetical protein
MMLRQPVAKAGVAQPPHQPSRISFAVHAPLLTPTMQQATTRDPPPGTYRTKPCRHYEKGRCTWGVSCRFLHAAGARGPAAPAMASVRIGGANPSASDSTSSAPAQVAPDTPGMPPTNPSTPAAVASPTGHHRYSHNPYSSSPMAGATPSPLASGKPTPLHFGAAFDTEAAPMLAALPVPMERMERRFSRA